jgi:hypothetical protein
MSNLVSSALPSCCPRLILRQCLRTFEKAGAGMHKIVDKRSAILEVVTKKHENVHSENLRTVALFSIGDERKGIRDD